MIPSSPERGRPQQGMKAGMLHQNITQTPERYYRQIYYEALDLITLAIESRFDQPGYKCTVACKTLSSKLLTRRTSVNNYNL